MAQGIIFGQAAGGLSSFIKNVQYVSVTLAGGSETIKNTTITEIVLANSYVMKLGPGSTSDNEYFNNAMAYAELTSTTNVKVSRTSDGYSGDDITVKLCIVEFETGIIKSKQTGIIKLTGGSQTSNTATITSVTQSKTILVCPGLRTKTLSFEYDAKTAFTNITLTNSTTVTASRSNDGYSGDNVYIAYQVIEFN